MVRSIFSRATLYSPSLTCDYYARNTFRSNLNILSKRLTDTALHVGQLKQLTHERRQQGIDVIDLGMGNPDRPTPQHIVDKLTEAAQEGRHHRYSASRGIYNLRREVSWYYERRFGVQIDPNHEAISVIGTKEGLSHLALALIDEAI